ncbi:MAG TPA: aspartate aminotransferase family protein [bacterium]|nr:aspartate aminotransferase family protein [bacterium]
MADPARLRSEGDINLSGRRARWQADHVDSETRAILDDDARFFFHQALSTPCLSALRACAGVFVEDLAGRRYLDFHGNFVHQVGHAHPEVVAAVAAQIDELAFCPRRYTNRTAVDLARKLVTLAPGDLGKVLFCPSGAGAIGIALKLARAATGRHKTISMWGSFHGASLDAISVGGAEIFRRGMGPLLPGAEHVPPPDPYRCAWGCHARGGCDLACARYIEYVLEQEGDVGAVVAETVRSTPVVPHPKFWRAVRSACDRHGALLILDEIPTALGRTGTMFACEQYDVVPDVVVIGKGLGGGVVPLAAVIGRPQLDVARDGALGHYTHEKSPVSCAAALATIGVIEREGLAARAYALGRLALDRLRAMMDVHPLIGDVRGIGLLLGVELVTDRVRRTRAVEEAEAVMYAALSRGLSFKVTMGNVLTLAPPLVITEQELGDALRILDESLTAVEHSGRRG